MIIRFTLTLLLFQFRCSNSELNNSSLNIRCARIHTISISIRGAHPLSTPHCNRLEANQIEYINNSMHDVQDRCAPLTLTAENVTIKSSVFQRNARYQDDAAVFYIALRHFVERKHDNTSLLLYVENNTFECNGDFDNLGFYPPPLSVTTQGNHSSHLSDNKIPKCVPKCPTSGYSMPDPLLSCKLCTAGTFTPNRDSPSCDACAGIPSITLALYLIHSLT